MPVPRIKLAMALDFKEGHRKVLRFSVEVPPANGGHVVADFWGIQHHDEGVSGAVALVLATGLPPKQQASLEKLQNWSPSIWNQLTVTIELTEGRVKVYMV